MKQKSYLIGWGVLAIITTIAFLVTMHHLRDVKSSIYAELDSINTQLSQEKVQKLSQDSLVKAALPLFFADPSFSAGVAKMPTSFPAFTNPTSDAGISLGIEDFSDYFKKVYKNTKADQVIITAVETDDPKILRWHIKVHERKKWVHLAKIKIKGASYYWRFFYLYWLFSVK